MGINWTRLIRRAVVRTTKRSTRWATKPYRDEKARQQQARRRRSTWRAR